MAGKAETLLAIDSAVDGMARLSNQLLSLARAEQGSASLRKDHVDFAVIAREAVENLTSMALAKPIDLGLETRASPLPLWGHEMLLRELVVNLVDNALRYTPAGGIVTVGLAREENEAILTVEDSGPGIPPVDRERVFGRFYRRLDSGGEGTGLGLAIVREIVASHDGSVKLKDQAAGPGLVVEVRLPIHQADVAAE